MTSDVLLLNADYTPIKVMAWERAVTLLMAEKVLLVTEYAGRVIRSPSIQMPWPAVVALKKYVNIGDRVRFNRANILARDSYTCLYCGAQPKTPKGNPKLEDLTIDHIIPRAQSRDAKVRLPSGGMVPVTSWQNVATACFPCNGKKADRTPAQAGMALIRPAKKPNAWDAVRMSFTRMHVPDEWKDFIPKGSGWGGYWTVELDND